MKTFFNKPFFKDLDTEIIIDQLITNQMISLSASQNACIYNIF